MYMNVESETLPKGTREKTQIETVRQMFALIELAQEKISSTDRIKSVTIVDKGYTLTIKPTE
jgi:hypothetical protein